MLRKIVTLILVLTALAAVRSLPQHSKEDELDEKDPFVRSTLNQEMIVIDKALIDEYCTVYRVGRRRCGKDLHPHCMENGSVILGSCRLKRAVCVENVYEDFGWTSCAIP